MSEVDEPKTFDEALSVLNPKERIFLLEHIKDFNGQRSAIAAGYSKKTARSKASQLLTKVNIQKALQCFFEDRKRNALKTADDVQRELEKIGFSNLTDVLSFTRDGLTLAKDSDGLSEEVKAAIKGVKFSENNSVIQVGVDMHDKVAALKLLGLQQGMFRQKLDVSMQVETYEQRRKRLGLDDMSPQEALEKFRRENGLVGINSIEELRQRYAEEGEGT